MSAVSVLLLHHFSASSEEQQQPKIDRLPHVIIRHCMPRSAENFPGWWDQHRAPVRAAAKPFTPKASQAKGIQADGSKIPQ